MGLPGAGGRRRWGRAAGLESVEMLRVGGMVLLKFRRLGGSLSPEASACGRLHEKVSARRREPQTKVGFFVQSEAEPVVLSLRGYARLVLWNAVSMSRCCQDQGCADVCWQGPASFNAPCRREHTHKSGIRNVLAGTCRQSQASGIGIWN